MRFFFLSLLLFYSITGFGQAQEEKSSSSKVQYRYIEPKFHFGSFLKSDASLKESGLLDNGYGAFTLKLGWQPSDPSIWSARYGYPSYGVGFYSGYLSDAAVFGNPNAIFGFINFNLSKPNLRHNFSIGPSLGLTYKLVPYDQETNPVNTAIGARMAVYFNLDVGFSYKWTREIDLIYRVDFTHFSNGSTFQPNSGLNLYGITVGMRYNYNRDQSRAISDLYQGDPLPARFSRPPSSPVLALRENSFSLYLAGGAAQNKALAGSNILKSTFTATLDYGHRFNEMHGIVLGTDLFFDDRLTQVDRNDRWIAGVHTGYDFFFYHFVVRMQVGTYLSDNRGKGSFFMRPALRYNITKFAFAQIGLKTLDRGAADYIEFGIGWRPFTW